MADMSAIEYKALMGEDGGNAFGGSGFLWIILIFLFFLAFSGGGLLGNNGTTGGMAQVERDVLTTSNATQQAVFNSSCATQKQVLEAQFANQLQFANMAAQQASCCCEIKQAISADGEATRALITGQIIQGLRDELSDAKTTLSNSNQSQYLLSNLGRFYPYPGVNPCGAFGGCGTC